MLTSEVPHCVCVALRKEKQEHPFGVVSPRLNYPLLFLCLPWGCSVWFLGCPWVLHCVSLSKPAWWLLTCLWTLCCVAVYACLVANCLSCRGPKRSLCSIFIVQYRRHHREKEWGFFFFQKQLQQFYKELSHWLQLTPEHSGLQTYHYQALSIYPTLLSTFMEGFCCVRLLSFLTITHIYLHCSQSQGHGKVHKLRWKIGINVTYQS